jgi:hypothetical protein
MHALPKALPNQLNFGHVFKCVAFLKLHSRKHDKIGPYCHAFDSASRRKNRDGLETNALPKT